MADWNPEYSSLLGNELVTQYPDTVLDQVIPQSVIFLAGLLFQQYVVREMITVEALLGQIAVNGPSVLTRVLKAILDYAQQNPVKASKSWPTLLKSQSFFDEVDQYMSDTYAARSKVAQV